MIDFHCHILSGVDDGAKKIFYFYVKEAYQKLGNEFGKKVNEYQQSIKDLVNRLLIVSLTP
ncbi:hypothetical protein LHA31_11570 [Carnobacterium viridans]|uniref:Uncharacterized protein n=1 Tax=Carnobacterium viridans TaxID=174587 RepID=A0A1H0YFA8_9LACT|nr:hypothetical protein [Carnobacterium viridans]UDE95160.1 hypothetical protein LHA31_11570 [Carnobacterium viridans]SDQ13939.1 hypothetical protein SAMN04487752_0919 [Carnobacterium viridans]